MDRCWLKGELGNALHAVLCATGYNLRRLMRAVLRLGLGPVCLCLTLLRLGSAPRRYMSTPGLRGDMAPA